MNQNGLHTGTTSMIKKHTYNTLCNSYIKVGPNTRRSTSTNTSKLTQATL